MITLKEYMKTVDYRITEGSDYHCNGLGTDLYSISAWNGDQDGWSTNIVFDTKNQTSYIVEVCDYKNNRAYRLINPDYKDAFMKGDSSEYRDQAWDDVNFVDLETDEDWQTKAEAIVNGEDYDTRVSIPIELPDHELMVLFKMAHERDMKFNDFVEEVLKEALKDFERDPESMKRRMQALKKDIFVKDMIKKDIL